MIKLKKLSFKGIGRFVEPQEISFDSLSNLVQIDGVNKNTGGSSGSGKSTVFNALDFLLGLNSIPNSALQSRVSEDTIFVSGEFDYDGKKLIISRGKKLSISIDGEVTTGSSEVSEEKLDQILSIPRNLFRPMLHKKQKEPGFFLNFTPAETNSFLTDCLGLGKFKNDIDNLDVKIADLSKMISTLTINLESSNTGLKASQDAISALGPAPTKDVDQSAILELKKQMDVANDNLKTCLEAQHLSENKFLEDNRPFLEPIFFDSSNIEKYEKEIDEVQCTRAKIAMAQKDKDSAFQQAVSDLKLKQSELNNKIQLGKTAKEEAKKLASEVLKVRKSICPRCEQSWINDTAKAEESKILDSINKLKGNILGAEHATVQLEAVTDNLNYILSSPKEDSSVEIQDLQMKEVQLKSLLSHEKTLKNNIEERVSNSNKSKQAEFEVKFKEFKKEQSLGTDTLRGQYDIYRRSFEAAIGKLKGYEEARTRYEGSFNTLKAQEYYYVQEVGDTDHKLVVARQQLEEVEELKRAIKSYLSCSFDEALDTISENATKMIQSIPNMVTATIQLEGTKETKKGKVKEEVNSVIHMDGEENIPIKTLSGGERASVDIAIDIAVLSFLEDRANKGIDVFILDEPFTGLEGVNIEMVLEVLKNANTHKKLIIVDHNPIVKEQISDRITIIREGLTSRVAQ